ncbi:DNA methyltransferase [Thioalkalivibrio sp. HK1]|uniref:DNA methyltransferase n=1 Tax=Thioalkalivibrio sp. HK1 TaxID=1469245 RepID=UPI0027D34113|nr:DNA methyltransferase [Thioalkalivibrio sp. HK1]
MYLDPPFNSKRDYAAPIGSEAAGAAFKDTWTLSDIDEAWIDILRDKYPRIREFLRWAPESNSDKSYLVYLAMRLIECHRVLASTGSLYLHCDPTMSHYLKILLDKIFGKDNFRNEIVWCYSTSGRSKKKFAAKHDIILFYSKSENYRFEYSLKISQKYLDSHYRQTDENGRRCRIRVDAGKVRIYYPEEGMTCNDWWTDIPYVNSQAKERTGYPTQKPLALLSRIIKASSQEGDIVLDPFAGCATTCVAAEGLYRRWIGIDISEKAVELVKRRIKNDLGILSPNVIHRTDIPKRTDIGKIPRYNSPEIKKHLFGKQTGQCAGCHSRFEFRHLEVDHYIAQSVGGTDHIDNLQLLCSSCNRIKGNRGQEYLITQLNLD